MAVNQRASYCRATVSLVALIGALNCAAPSLAQVAATSASASGDSADTGIEEIIVTAQKRAQRLSDVGISIVTHTAQQLQSAGVTDVMQLGKVTPGLVATQTQSGYSIFSIRGVNFNSNQISAAPTVSTYIDEAALPLPAMTGALLLGCRAHRSSQRPAGNAVRAERNGRLDQRHLGQADIHAAGRRAWGG
jgi:outer membrane receptor protein involved in Fe transport